MRYKFSVLALSVVVILNLSLSASEVSSELEVSSERKDEQSTNLVSASSQLISQFEDQEIVEIGEDEYITKEQTGDKVVAQNYKQDKLSSEIIYEGDYKYINSYEQGVLVKSIKYLGESIVQVDQYNNQQPTYSTIYDNQLTTYIEYQSGVNHSLKQYQNNQLLFESSYYPSGTIEKSMQYEKGKLSIEMEYDQNQNLVSIINYQDGLIVSNAKYDNGVLNLETTYTTKGKLQSETVYQAGKIIKYTEYESELVSRVTDYYENSEATERIREYQDGQVVSDISYHQNGNFDRERRFNQEGIEIARYYYQNNKLEAEYKFDENGLYTKYYKYYPSGATKVSIKYQEGIPQTRQKYTEEGVVTSDSVYKSSGEGIAYTTNYYPSGIIKSTAEHYEQTSAVKKAVYYNQDGSLKRVVANTSNGVVEKKFIYNYGELETKTYFDQSGDKLKRDYYIDDIIRRTARYDTDGSYALSYYAIDGTIIRKDFYNKEGMRYKVKSYTSTTKRSGYKTKEVSVCDMTTTRAENVVVDIGFDSKYTNRDYYGYTNKYGQLTLVEASQVIAQNENYEDVVAGRSGLGAELRYCKTEAQVTGSKPAEYDRGHVLADSMGGVANAYNITPQIEEINVNGAQHQMEQMFRVAFANKQTVTDFQMKMSYKNKNTNIPYKYAVKFKIDGKQYSFSAYNK